MPYHGIFINWRQRIRFKGTARQGQIATLIVLFVAVVALLAAILVNISRIAQRRTTVVNAATGGVMQLASSLGSYAHNLSCRSVGCRDKKCKWSWKALIQIVVAVIFIVLAIVTANPMLIFMAINTSFNAIMSQAVFEPQALNAMNRSFAKMVPSLQISEQAIRYALLTAVDDTAKVADMHDLDMDGNYGTHNENGIPVPNDEMNRFFYRYQQRLMWLTGSGPAPDGSRNAYRVTLENLIANFRSALTTFRRAENTFRTYMGVDPWEERHQRQTWFYNRDRYDLENINSIDSLYRLFAYLERREYPYLLQEQRYGRYRNSDASLYHLSYHTQPRLVNVWTEGFLPCDEDDVWDENPNDPCLTDTRNDEVDFLKSSMSSFDDLAGDILDTSLSSAERYIAFFEWYPEIYDTDDTGDFRYDNWYDETWSIPDNPASPAVVERGWMSMLNSWRSRLNSIASDINRRIQASPWSWWRRGNSERYRLQRLLLKVETAKTQVNNFRSAISNFRTAIERLRDGYNQLNDDPFGNTANAELLLFSRNAPAYVWHDSLGWHSVSVRVSNFKLATLKAKKKGFCCKVCVYLKNKSGTPWVRVTRVDWPTEARLSGARFLLWRFQYPTVSYTARASYSYTSAPPRFLGVQKNN